MLTSRVAGFRACTFGVIHATQLMFDALLGVLAPAYFVQIACFAKVFI